MEEVGFVKSIRDFLLYLDGLPTIRVNDLVQNEAGVRGWASALFEDSVEVLLLDEPPTGGIKVGEMFKKLNSRLTLAVGDFLLARSINPLGVAIDGKGPLGKTKTDQVVELDKQATGISSRQFISEQFDSGITVIDTLIPIGKGQRELVVGDARSGKTSFLIDLIVNQKGGGNICVYASIGKPITEVRSLIDVLKANEALSYTIVIAASSTDTAPLIYLAPQTALAVAEYFQKQGKDVLLILDDMGNHAKIYREIALLGNKAPGRESYPGDIFYQHSHLLERAGNFKKEFGGGSITAIPVVELNLADFTTFIPTNLMAMTDGHWLFKSAFYNQGQRPAIDIPLSVSRIGQQTQIRLHNLLSSKIKQILAQSISLETVSRFSSELPEETQLILKEQEQIHEILSQESLTNIPKNVQMALLGLVFTSFLKDQDANFIKTQKGNLIEAFSKDPKLADLVRQIPQMADVNQLFEKLESVVPILKEITKVKEEGLPTKLENVTSAKVAQATT